MTERQQHARAFIAANGWGAATQTLLAGDASNRRYDRLEKPDGSTIVFMDAPAEKGEDVRPFVTIANWLCSIGLSAPKILAQDPVQGFLLIEDLGDALFARHVLTHPSEEEKLYAAAVDLLTALHKAPPPALEEFTARVTTDLAALVFEWYQKGTLEHVDQQDEQNFRTIFFDLLSPLDAQATVLVQRDYHAENLIWLPERDKVKRVGLLDFQGAVLGHPAYDLVSVLQDARRDVDPDLAQRMITRYVTQNNVEKDSFEAAYSLLGAQRNLRILGVFARLCLRDGKASYVDLIPRVWRHLQTDLAHPALKPIAGMLNTALPEPSPEILERLKSQCATRQMP